MLQPYRKRENRTYQKGSTLPCPQNQSPPKKIRASVETALDIVQEEHALEIRQEF